METHYKHYKGGEYTKVCLAVHTEDNGVLMIYKSLGGRIYARPLTMFNEKVYNDEGELVSRFQEIESQCVSPPKMCPQCNGDITENEFEMESDISGFINMGWDCKKCKLSVFGFYVEKDEPEQYEEPEAPKVPYKERAPRTHVEMYGDPDNMGDDDEDLEQDEY